MFGRDETRALSKLSTFTNRLGEGINNIYK